MEPHQNLIRLTSGITGSGKTHFSLLLQRQGWVRFSLDELMLSFYGPSSSLEEWLARDTVIFNTLKPMAIDLVKRSQPIVFDWSSESAALRQKFVRLAQSLNQHLVIDAFNIDEALAWQRIEQRNQLPGAYPVNRAILETSIKQWQPPLESEGAYINWHNVTPNTRAPTC